MTTRIPVNGELQEDELLRLAKAGDKEAFTEIVRRHEPAVLTLANRLSDDSHMAADIAQEAMIRAWKGLDSFRGDAAISTWLHRITVNVAWTHRKRAVRRRALPIEDVAHSLDAGPGVRPEEMGEAAMLGRTIRRSIRALPVGLRAVVVLKDVYGWSHAEISEALGISVTATKVRLHRGRTRLQADLEGRV